MGNDTKRYSLIHTGLKTDDRLMNLTLCRNRRQEACSQAAADEEESIRWIQRTGTFLHFIKAPEKQRQRNSSYQTILDSCNGKTRRNATGYSFVWSEVVDDSSGWI